jgi:GT2 family glycosyltransferase
MDDNIPWLREEPKVLCFVCVYIRRDVLNKLGPLDERFIAYGWEDNDYCRRALADGYKLGIYDPVQVEHGTLKSTFRGYGHCDMTYNQRIYEQKWGISRRSPIAPDSE